ncbi:MAG: hypothetical protein J1F65_02795 [Clostridiales bacterium]|nr:hypothetical protein [Clostridiales bacterium]
MTLGVGAKQGEFHPIDSVATSIDVCDIVEVLPRSDELISVHGVDGVEQENNAAYKAAVAFRNVFAKYMNRTAKGVEIFVQKGIPFGGGLGGSSADAAAVVYCMCKMFGVDVHSQEVHELCLKLGSDVNFMLFGGLGRLQGKGDDVTFYALAKPMYFALTVFDCSTSSGEVYSAFDNQQKNACFSTPCSFFTLQNNDLCLDLLQNGKIEQAMKLFSNDLQQATASINNYADGYLNFVRSNGMCCSMTGSGSAYYVSCVTKKEAERVGDLLNANGFTTIVCKSAPNGIIEI